MAVERVLTSGSERATLATNKLIRNTYTLLSMTLLFSAVMAGVAMAVQAPPVHWLLMLGLLIGGPFAIYAVRNSGWAILLTFAFTGALGFFLGPILSLYLALPNGGQIVATSLGLTGAIFLGLSGYALTTRKDFSFLRGFVFVGLLVVLGAILLNLFLQIPVLSLMISAAAVLVLSAAILFDTSRMVHGGEENYVLMTVSLYANLYVMFLHMLNLVAAFTGND
jgi:modulator of FtsH protease